MTEYNSLEKIRLQKLDELRAEASRPIRRALSAPIPAPRLSPILKLLKKKGSN